MDTLDEKEKNGNSDYMVDVAGERVYQNQNEEYYKAYTKWRNSPKNKFAYTFVHDTREHIYVDGEGFADKIAARAERDALLKCLQLLGTIMIAFFVTQVALYVIMDKVYDVTYAGWVYFSEQSDIPVVSSAAVYFHCTFRIFTYIALIVCAKLILKIPNKVVYTNERLELKPFVFGLSLALMFAVCGRFFDYIFAYLSSKVGLNACLIFQMKSDSFAANLFFTVSEFMIIPVAAEIFFRGFILQLFRQFGDGFAIIVSALATALCYHSIEKSMFIFVLSLILGVITVRNGSLFSAIYVRIAVAALSMSLNFIAAYSDDATYKFMEICISLLIVGISFAIFAYLRRNGDTLLYMKEDATELTVSQKLRMLIYSDQMVIWMLCSLVSTILCLRFI